MANTRFHAALFGPPRLPRGTVDPFTQRVETVGKSHGRLSVPVIQPRSLMPLAPPEVSADVNIILDCMLPPCSPELDYAVIVAASRSGAAIATNKRNKQGHGGHAIILVVSENRRTELLVYSFSISVIVTFLLKKKKLCGATPIIERACS
jgi:hypothetical protein